MRVVRFPYKKTEELPREPNMYGYNVEILSGKHAGRVMALQGTEGRYALLYLRLGLGRAEFQRELLSNIRAVD